MSNFLPVEVVSHTVRLSKEAIQWLEENIERNLSLDQFTEKLFELIDQNEIIDAEIAYIACKAGVMTSKLAKVINLGEAKHPAIRAYQGLAYLFLNNFTMAEEFLEKAELEAEKIQDILVLAEIYGIKIYLYNARYQFFQGVKIIQKAFEIMDKSKNRSLIDANPAFLQWIRISGAKSLLKLGNIPEALYTNKRALKIATQGNDRFFKSYAYLGVGHCFDLIGKTNEAVVNYKKALKIAHELKAYNLISIIYNRLGMAVAWRMDKLSDGESYFSEAIISAEMGECLWLKEGPQWNLIALYRAKKDYNSAINEIHDIIESTRKVGESRTELIALLNLGELLEEKGELKEATKVREAAESLATLIGIDVDEFYESDEEEELEEGEDSDEEVEFEAEDFDTDQPAGYEFEVDEDLAYRENHDMDDVLEKSDFASKFQFDDRFNDENENGADTNNDVEDEEINNSDDILRKFFRKYSN